MITDSAKQKPANDCTSLRQQSHLDLTERARGGIVIYLAVWLTTANSAGIIQGDPFLFYLNTFIFFVVSIIRIFHYLHVKRRPDSNTRRMYFLLIALILFSAIHWGTMSAWIIFGSEYQILYYPYMVVLAAFAIGGTAVLSISQTVRICYPLFIFGPAYIASLMDWQGGTVLHTLVIFSLFYVFEASRVTRNDYWKAINSSKEADDRALQMEMLSITDQLTGLHNRMYFNKCFSNEWDRCKRFQLPLSVIMIDLDHFKLINDTYGHLAGDECLQKVAEVLKSEIKRSTDIIARYGGEEFLVILPDIDLAISTEIAERLVRAVARIELAWDDQPTNVTCSIGLASIIPDRQRCSRTLLEAADDAMYQAKAGGRNQYFIAKELL